MKNISEYLCDKYGKWGWLGQRAHDASGIMQVLPLDFIVCCDHGTDVPLYFREEDVLSIEKRSGTRKDWSNEHLKNSLKGPLGREVFRKWEGYAERINLLCYRSLNRLEQDDGNTGFLRKIYAVPELLKRHFDNKVTLCRSLPGLPVSDIPCSVVQLGKAEFGELRRDLDLPFVLQFPYGSSGKFTFKIEDERAFKSLSAEYTGQVVTARKYIDGFSMNVNGVVVTGENGPEVFCSFPAVQIVGIPECSNFPTSFCGNDYASARDVGRDVIDKIEDAVKVLGKWMSGKGYRGIFGLDLVIKDGVVYPIEINPRFQNSTSLYTMLEHIQKPEADPLFLLHIAEFLQDKDKVLREYVKNFSYNALMDPIEGSQIIVHNKMGAAVVTGKMEPGVYSPNENGFKKTISTAVLGKAVPPEDFLVTCAVPGVSVVVDSNAPLCKIQTTGRAVDSVDMKSLTSGMKEAVSFVYDKLKLKKERKEKIGV